jgi:hypothetical protein
MTVLHEPQGPPPIGEGLVGPSGLSPDASSSSLCLRRIA